MKGLSTACIKMLRPKHKQRWIALAGDGRGRGGQDRGAQAEQVGREVAHFAYQSALWCYTFFGTDAVYAALPLLRGVRY
eukprot:2785023-Rhodomonas_salina.1